MKLELTADKLKSLSMTWSGSYVQMIETILEVISDEEFHKLPQADDATMELIKKYGIVMTVFRDSKCKEHQTLYVIPPTIFLGERITLED